MKRIMLIAGLTLLTAGVSVLHGQSEKPAFKGMELYSWNPVEKGWHFSLLPGTNREKTISEITSPEQAIAGVDALKAKLALLPKGETVFWRNMAKEPVPSRIMKDLMSFCEEHSITLKQKGRRGQSAHSNNYGIRHYLNAVDP